MIRDLLNLLVYLLVVGLIVGAIHYVCDTLPIREPFNRMIKLVSVVIGVVIIVIVLLQLLTGGLAELPRL